MCGAWRATVWIPWPRLIAITNAGDDAEVRIADAVGHAERCAAVEADAAGPILDTAE